MTTRGTTGMVNGRWAISRPSMADATEIGGVMMPSARSAVAPRIVGIASHLALLLTSAYREKMPPSPALSAFRVSQMYLMEV